MDTKEHGLGVLELIPKRIADARGFLSETYSAAHFAEFGIHLRFVQDNNVYTEKAGVLRKLTTSCRTARSTSSCAWFAADCSTSPSTLGAAPLPLENGLGWKSHGGEGEPDPRSHGICSWLSDAREPYRSDLQNDRNLFAGI